MSYNNHQIFEKDRLPIERDRDKDKDGIKKNQYKVIKSK